MAAAISSKQIFKNAKQALKNKWSWIALIIVVVLLILIIRPFLVAEGYKRPKTCRYNKKHKPDAKNYYYRRRANFEGKDPYWQCQLGWQDTGCDWSDGREYGNKQCRRHKKQKTKDNNGNGHSNSVFVYYKPHYGGSTLKVEVGQKKVFSSSDNVGSIKIPNGVDVILWRDFSRYKIFAGPLNIPDMSNTYYNPKPFGQTHFQSIEVKRQGEARS